MPDAEIFYYPQFIQDNAACAFFTTLQHTLAWKQEQITLYGKTFDVPRLQAWYGDKGADYQYSKLRLTPRSWTDELFTLKELCEKELGETFNSVLANLYRNGQDSMGRHADNEPELGPHPTIASLSFGGTRNLDFHHTQTKQKVRVPLVHGSLLVMKGATQEYWQHGIVKSKQAFKPRINLTFRDITHQAS